MARVLLRTAAALLPPCSSRGRAALLVLLVVEALFLQLLCTGYQWVLVQRVEAARLVGILAMLGLPGPVLRQLASKEAKVGWEGARACWTLGGGTGCMRAVRGQDTGL